MGEREEGRELGKEEWRKGGGRKVHRDKWREGGSKGGKEQESEGVREPGASK